MNYFVALFVVTFVATTLAGPVSHAPLKPMQELFLYPRTSEQLKDYQNPEALIVGGEEANINNFRYQLSLRYYDSHICGASAISDTWALCAAHCIIDYVAANYKLFGGAASRTDANGVLVNVEQVLGHPNYNGNTYDNDVALFRTSGLLSSRPGLVTAISLGDGSLPADGATMTVSGWGVTVYEGTNVPLLLRYVTVPKVNRDTCNSAHGGAITANMFCASASGRDACQGDSGGPIVVGNVQYGVVSWGINCAHPSWPGVYAHIGVTGIRSWIRSYTGV